MKNIIIIITLISTIISADCIKLERYGSSDARYVDARSNLQYNVWLYGNVSTSIPKGTWNEAVDTCKNIMVPYGKPKWRLPSISELMASTARRHYHTLDHDKDDTDAVGCLYYYDSGFSYALWTSTSDPKNRYTKAYTIGVETYQYTGHQNERFSTVVLADKTEQKGIICVRDLE